MHEDMDFAETLMYEDLDIITEDLKDPPKSEETHSTHPVAQLQQI